MSKIKETIKVIKERDWPMSEKQCIEAFERAVGRKPTKKELSEMKPERKPAPVFLVIVYKLFAIA